LDLSGNTFIFGYYLKRTTKVMKNTKFDAGQTYTINWNGVETHVMIIWAVNGRVCVERAKDARAGQYMAVTDAEFRALIIPEPHGSWHTAFDRNGRAIAMFIPNN
jgi:hypothetical protein